MDKERNEREISNAQPSEEAKVERLYYTLGIPRNRSRMCFLFYLFIIPLYIIIGGITFSLAEMDASQEALTNNAQLCVAERKTLMENLKASMEDDFLTNFNASRNFTHTWDLISRAIMKIENCHREKLFQIAPVEPFVFKNALLYSFCVYTTIGYGNLYPRTVRGRLLTVAYAVVGIPLNVAFIADLGELMARAIQCGLRYLRRNILNKKTIDLWIEYKKFAVVILIAILFTPLLAVIVMKAEHIRRWSYIDSLYYTFTTSTLIGLGDFVPQPSHVQFFILTPLFLIAESIIALMFGFITHLYRYESVALYKLILLKFSSVLLHRRLMNMINAQQSDGHAMQLQPLMEKKAASVADVASATQKEVVDAQIAKLSARGMQIQKKINEEVKLLEAIPSRIDVGLLNARIRSDGGEQCMRHKLKRWLQRKQKDEDMK